MEGGCGMERSEVARRASCTLRGTAEVRLLSSFGASEFPPQEAWVVPAYSLSNLFGTVSSGVLRGMERLLTMSGPLRVNLERVDEGGAKHFDVVWVSTIRNPPVCISGFLGLRFRE